MPDIERYRKIDNHIVKDKCFDRYTQYMYMIK